MPAKSNNEGAFTVRPSRKLERRRDYLELVDAMNEEIAINRKVGKGPTSQTSFVMEMLREKFAAGIARKKERAKKNQERLTQDARTKATNLF